MLGVEGQGKEVGGVTAEEEGLLSIGIDGKKKLFGCKQKL